MRGGDTVVALSSGALPAGVAVVRLSGPKAGELLAEFSGALPPPRRLTLTDIADHGQILDRGLVAWFPAPRSFTGEDCAELQVHGSRAVVRSLLRSLTSRNGVRLAEAGEFTRRAFDNGRLDLTAVEGLGDLIEAETENQRRQAMARADGGLFRKIGTWRARLLDVRAEIEVRLDFSDEGDVDAVLPESVAQAVADLRMDMVEANASFENGRIIRDGLRVAIAGSANAGKSSLLNALVKSDVAIVSDEPGTTRDVREVALDLGGQLVILVDMAGFRDTVSKAEAEGVRRAWVEIGMADLVLWLVAPDVLEGERPSAGVAPVWQINSKADLALGAGAGSAVSSATGHGLPELLDRIEAFAAEQTGTGEPALLSHERDRAAMDAAIGALADVDMELGRLELAADSLRRASDALARLTGEIDAEMVLDRLFSAFCIGK